MGRKKRTTESFINESRVIHGDVYDYSQAKYTGRSVKVTIICPKHGPFEQAAQSHLKGHGCRKCGTEKSKDSSHWCRTKKDFIRRAKEIHGEYYDYSNIKYTGQRQKVTIICSQHGPFEQRADLHIQTSAPQGCKKCKNPLFSVRTNQSFIERAEKIHGQFYDYSMVEYSHSHENVTIICPKHGPFEQKASNHLNGCGCPTCSESKGEKAIRIFLEERCIPFESQKTYDDLQNKNPLRYDFFIQHLNLLIEYNGQQHYEVINYFGGEERFKRQQKHDRIKSQYAKGNNINLLIISYKEFDEIETILKKALSL